MDVYSAEMSVQFRWNTRRYIPLYGGFHRHLYVYLKFKTFT
jgi:hypothetical protein